MIKTKGSVTSVSHGCNSAIEFYNSFNGICFFLEVPLNYVSLHRADEN